MNYPLEVATMADRVARLSTIAPKGGWYEKNIRLFLHHGCSALDGLTNSEQFNWSGSVRNRRLCRSLEHRRLVRVRFAGLHLRPGGEPFEPSDRQPGV